MVTNKEKSKCCGCEARLEKGTSDIIFNAFCKCSCHKPPEPQVDKQQEECEHLNVRCPVICNDCGITLKNAPLTYPIKQEYKQQEVKEEFITLDQYKKELIAEIKELHLHADLYVLPEHRGPEYWYNTGKIYGNNKLIDEIISLIK